MPDMVQLIAGTGAIAVYVAAGFAAKRAWLVLFYTIIGLGSLAKGAAGFVPLAVVIGDTIIAHGGAGLRRLVSIPGWVVLAGLALPWWIVAAASAGHRRFVHGFVLNDQLLSYFGRDQWGWQTIAEPISFAVTVLLPWGLLLPFAIRRALREADPDTVRRLRLLLIWLATVFVMMAVSGKQRERYYLPLCPAAALLIGWWYSTLAWRGRARAFAGAWIAVVAAGVVLVKLDTPHFNATTDLRALRTVLSQAPAPLYSLDLQDLALSFNLDRPVVNAKSLERFEAGVRQGEMGYLIVSDRALAAQTGDPCVRRIARGLVTRQPFTVLDPSGCGPRALSPDDRRAG
jgi:4-amino-4-deoxy-L-arabinose transferase-like glycosyltransferase